MQRAQQLPTITPPMQLDSVRLLVDSSLLGNWMIQIEHCDVDQFRTNYWNLWDKPLFAINGSQPVIDQILACNTCHPEDIIRLYAKCSRPETSIAYTIYVPQTEITHHAETQSYNRITM